MTGVAVAGSAVTAVVTQLMHSFSVPTYTWPFVLTLWAGLAVVHFAPRLHRA
jgi:urea transporter